MVEHYGSQCGYCTPGFVVSMFEGYYRDDIREPVRRSSDQLSGNLCRCTGYRPIRDALRRRAARAGEAPAATTSSSSGSRRDVAALPRARLRGARRRRFLRPTTLAELLALRQAMPGRRARRGATEIGVDVNKKFGRRSRSSSRPTACPSCARITKTETTLASSAARRRSPRSRRRSAGEFPSLGEDAEGLRLAADPEPRHARRQPRHRVADRRHGAGAAVARRASSSSRRPARRADGAARRVLHRLPQDGARARRDHAARSCIPRRVRRRARAPARESYKVSKRRELDISIVAAAFVDRRRRGGRRARTRASPTAASRPTPVRAREDRGAARRQAVERGDACGRARRSSPESSRRSTTCAAGADVPAAASSSACSRSSVARRDEPGAGRAARLRARATPCTERPDAELARARSTRARSATSPAARSTSTTGAAPADARDVAGHARPTRAHGSTRATRRRRARCPASSRVLIAEDIPGHNDVGAIRNDEPLLADGEVHFHGQVVAMVVGESLEACRAAAAKVVVEYEPLPPLLSIAEAIAAGELPHAARTSSGAATASAALAREPAQARRARFDIGGQEHFYLETPGGVGRARARTATCSSARRRSTRPRSRRSSRTCCTCRGTRWSCSRRAWAAASAARRRRATPSRRWWRSPRGRPAARCGSSSTATST